LPPPTPTLNKYSRTLFISTIGRNLKILSGHYYFGKNK
jgi:hypothetical protein